jgi:hypothetical protein
VEVAAVAGITRVIHAGRPGKDHLLDSAGTGAAWLDYDRDGRIDAYIVNSWLIEGDRIAERGRNALYRNRGDGTFEDVTDRARVAGEGRYGSGVAVADYDGDGWADLFVTAFGANILYRNRGDGTFQNVAPRAGVEAPGWNTGAAFLDADGDGDLDLYIAAYIECTEASVLAAKPALDWKGVDRVAMGPFGMEGALDHFFLSDGNGGFTDATASAGLTDLGHGYGFTVVAGDFTGDGRPDIYVANDSDANYLYRNEGNGRFKETALWTGTALDINGASQAGMGVAAGDADGDGLMDIVVTNFSEDFTTYYRAVGAGFFDDASGPSGVGAATFMSLSWGVVLADLDSDGDEDLVIANGHIYPQVDAHPEFGMTYRQRNQILENTGGGRFRDVTASAGPGFQIALPSRAIAAGDYDDDGDVDLLVTNLDAPPSLLRNDGPQGHRLTVILDAARGAGPAIGSRVTVKAGGLTLVREAASSGSFMSSHDPRMHFGLGQASKADSVEVRWPDGSTTIRTEIPADGVVRIPRGAMNPGAVRP